MQRVIERLWQEDGGFVLSSEVMMYGTLGVVGLGAGLTALRDSVNSELNDVAKAIGSVDQSYWYSPVVGHSAWTAGSAFFDRADVCDGPQPIPVPVAPPPCERPIVCADVFGPQHGPVQDKYVLPPVTSRPRPDSLPGPGAARHAAPAVVEERVIQHHPHQHHPHHVPTMHPDGHPGFGPSKGVYIGEVGPTMVLGAPGLVPVPYCNGVPVNVHVNPWQAGPYGFNVPEGYFNHGPGAAWNGVMPYYRMLVEDRIGPRDYGYNYAPADKPGVRQGAETIDLGFAKVGDDELKSIDDFKTAKCLHVLGSNVTDKGLGYIAEMEQLESLHLVGTQATDAGMKEIAKLKKLRFLHLIGTRISDKGLASLAGMKQLEELDVRGTPVTDDGLIQLRKVLPALRIIR
jgi:hypothetical protein